MVFGPGNPGKIWTYAPVDEPAGIMGEMPVHPEI